MEKKITHEVGAPDFSKYSIVAYESANEGQCLRLLSALVGHFILGVRQTSVKEASKPLDMMKKFPEGVCSETHHFRWKILKSVCLKMYKKLMLKGSTACVFRG